MSNEQLLEIINKRFDKLEEEIETVKEHCEITRDSVNTLIEWSDTVGDVLKVPLIRAE